MFHILLETAVGSVGRDHPCFQSSMAASITTTVSEKATEMGKTKIVVRVAVLPIGAPCTMS